MPKEKKINVNFNGRETSKTETSRHSLENTGLKLSENWLNDTVFSIHYSLSKAQESFNVGGHWMNYMIWNII